MAFEAYAARTADAMRDVLMDADAPGPAIHYYMVRGGKVKGNITVLESGTVGGEYIKTYGHYHLGELDETYHFLQGSGIVLQQKLVDPREPARVEEFKVTRVRAGDSVYMPPGYGHLMVNTGDTWLVMADDSPVEGPDDSASMPGHADYSGVKAMRGFSYYVVERGGAPALVRNPLYKDVGNMDFGGLEVVES